MESREERKVVTVLFTDLVGFTGRAEELDPEDVRAMLSPYYARLREQIEQRGGTVEKFIGDAVMAVFGAPVAHEDDPVRAVLTALAIRDAVRESSPELQLRTAVNTGEALVALDADPASGEGLASGDVVNTAARLQAAAPVDGILVGEATHRATRHVIDYREAQPVEAKGKSRPIPVWEVVGARSRYGTDVEQAHASALVGRGRELFLLRDAFARCRSEETAQLVTLVGVPGIGKSRLVAELFSVLDAEPDVYRWRQGRSLPYGESRSVWALGEIVKSQAGILENDDTGTAAQKLAEAVADVIADERERRWVESHLQALVGVTGGADESADRRVEAFSAWRRFFEALAEEHPLVLVFEDLHWGDETLLDFVDHLAEWASGVPILVVATARPELLDRRPDWGGGKRNATTLSIRPLSEAETAQLLAAVLHRPLLDADTQRAVLQRAEGNPLYAAEFARMVAEHPAGDLPLPETVQGVIAARIDALPPGEKALLQDAAVLGKVFWPGAVGSPAIDLLHALERKEFVRRDRRSAVAGEPQYAFLHLLVRDVAYGQIPRARRMEKHRAAAAWIETLSPDRTEDRAEMLAHHYREALRLARAAGLDDEPLRVAALGAVTEASERAAASSAWAAAAELAAEALALAGDGDGSLRPELQLRLARARAFSTAESEHDLASAARDGFLAAGNLAKAADCEALLSYLAWWTSDGDGARAHARRALELVHDLPTSLEKARAHAQAARLEGIGGDPVAAVALANETLALAEELDRDELRSSALNTRGIARADLGDARALEDLARSIELADRSNAPHEIATSRNNYASVLVGLGRLTEANAGFDASREAALRFGSRGMAHWAALAGALHRLPTGGLDACLATADELEHDAGEGTQLLNAVRFLRGWVHAVRGETGPALRLLERSLEGARRTRDAQTIAPTLAATASALLLGGRDAEAEKILRELLSDPELNRPGLQFGELPLLLAERGRGHEWLAAVPPGFDDNAWVRVGAALAEGDHLAAAEIYRTMGARFFEAWARLLAAEGGDASQLEPARAFFASERTPPFLRRCEAVLAASA